MRRPCRRSIRKTRGGVSNSLLSRYRFGAHYVRPANLTRGDSTRKTAHRGYAAPNASDGSRIFKRGSHSLISLFLIGSREVTEESGCSAIPSSKCSP